MAASSYSRLQNPSDFIEPAPVCTKPPQKLPPKDNIDQLDGGVVKIDLGDCLACSGCVTTAETVLLADQTVHLIQEALDVGKHVVMTVCGPTVTAFMAILKQAGISMDAGRVFALVKKLLVNQKRIHSVQSMSQAQAISVHETALEFLQRYTKAKTSQNPVEEKSKPSCLFPMFTSVCPGWICFAEKAHHDMLPLISTTRSPQAIAGLLAKNYLQTNARDLFHVCVMSCYDKKLEASREDFRTDGRKETDCVLTTGELLSWMGGRDAFVKFAKEENPHIQPDQSCKVLEGSSAGGYLEWTLHLTGLKLIGQKWRESLNVNKKNADFIDYTLNLNQVDGSVIRFAAVYGFRNIQTVLRKIKASRDAYDFVEIMACPGACLNGGGQPLTEIVVPEGPDRKKQSSREALSLMQTLYDDPKMMRQYANPLEELRSKETEQVMREFLGGHGSPLLQTTYRPVPIGDSKIRAFQVQW